MLNRQTCRFHILYGPNGSYQLLTARLSRWVVPKPRPAASPIAAGSRVYLLDEEGTTFVVEANADRYTEVARNALDEMSLASPAAAGGALYVRTATKLYKIG